MELGSLVALANDLLLGQLDEVLGGLWDGLAEDAELNGAGRHTSNLNVKKYLKVKINVLLRLKIFGSP